MPEMYDLGKNLPNTSISLRVTPLPAKISATIQKSGKYAVSTRNPAFPGRY